MSYKKELSFGLDIGDRSLKILQFVSAKKVLRVEGFAEVMIPPNVIENGIIKDSPALASYIRTLIKQAGTVAQQVVLALPERKTFLKFIRLNHNSKMPLRPQIEQELAHHLPYEIGEVFWDHCVIEDRNGTLAVLAGAAPKKIVNAYVDCIQRAKLTPILLDVEPLAIARAAINAKNPESCTLLVDLGGTKSTLVLADSRTVFATTDARSAGEDLTAAIAEGLQVEKKAAEELKIKHGLGLGATKGGPEQYLKLTQRYAKNLTERISQFIGFSLKHESLCQGISQILLSGGGALLAGLPPYLSNNLKIPVSLADPWIQLDETVKKSIDIQTRLRFTTATGLALKALEFDHAV